MATQKKLGTPQGVGQWKALETAGDVKRFIRWCILSVRDQSLDARTAGVLGQLGCYLLKAVETADLEARLAVIENALQEPDDSLPSNASLPH
jgi:hypothetical protein